MSLFSLLCNLYPRYTLHPIPKVHSSPYTQGTSSSHPNVHQGTLLHSSPYTQGTLLYSTLFSLYPWEPLTLFTLYNPRDTPTLFTLYGYTQGTLRHSSPYTVTLSLQASYTIHPIIELLVHSSYYTQAT